MCYEVYKVCQKKIYDNSSIKLEWVEKEVNGYKDLT